MSAARLLVSPRWLLRHVLLVAAVTTCWFFGRWQFHRAVHRHSVLNWSYTVEWTLFAGFAVLSWAWFLRDELRGPAEEQPEPEPQTAVSAPAVVPVSEDEDPELAAYNRMLAELHRSATRR